MSIPSMVRAPPEPAPGCPPSLFPFLMDIHIEKEKAASSFQENSVGRRGALCKEAAEL